MRNAKDPKGVTFIFIYINAKRLPKLSARVAVFCVLFSYHQGFALYGISRHARVWNPRSGMESVLRTVWHQGFALYLLLLLLESCALLRLEAFSCGCVKDDLAESDGLGSYLDELLVGDKLDSFLKRELNGGDEGELFVSTR